ncbi:MAG TPA: HAMP domain-containing sensor histidine kinase [Longimicrobiales bacterium]
MSPGPRTGRQKQQQTAFDNVASSGGSFLQAAAERVRNVAFDLSPNLAPQDIVSELSLLCVLITQSSTLPFQSVNDGPAKVQLRSRLLDLLRAEAVRMWSETPPEDSRDMLPLLQGIERLKMELEGPVFDESRQRLSDSRGLELAVELAHDLRSPLTSILFLSETLLRGGSGPINEIQHRQLGIVYSAALGLIGTASNVIELARGGEQSEMTDATPFSLAEILEGVRDMVMPIAEEKALELRVNTLHPDRRLGYPIPLSRVLLNLTANALKFTDSGSVELTVQPVKPGRVEVSVRDTGRGIDEAALATLFQPIRRRGGGRRGYQIAGTGLGLSICRKLVTAMGSELQLETRANWGTRFYFELDLPPVP